MVQFVRIRGGEKGKKTQKSRTEKKEKARSKTALDDSMIDWDCEWNPIPNDKTSPEQGWLIARPGER